MIVILVYLLCAFFLLGWRCGPRLEKDAKQWWDRVRPIRIEREVVVQERVVVVPVPVDDEASIGILVGKLSSIPAEERDALIQYIRQRRGETHERTFQNANGEGDSGDDEDFV